MAGTSQAVADETAPAAEQLAEPGDAAASREPAATEEPAAEVRPRPLDDSEASDPNVIVVEDEPATFRMSEARPPRREFRQLFSKLRRG